MLGISRLWIRINYCFLDYERLQNLLVYFIYVQIGTALIGSLGALFNGVLLINLAVALFALVAIFSSSHHLCRIYALLVACTILIDCAWFVMFSNEIMNISTTKYEPLVIFSLRLELWMQSLGFAARLLSSFLLIQIYRLGASTMEMPSHPDVPYYMRNSCLNHATDDTDRGSSDSLFT